MKCTYNKNTKKHSLSTLTDDELREIYQAVNPGSRLKKIIWNHLNDCDIVQDNDLIDAGYLKVFSDSDNFRWEYNFELYSNESAKEKYLYNWLDHDPYGNKLVKEDQSAPAPIPTLPPQTETKNQDSVNNDVIEYTTMLPCLGNLPEKIKNDVFCGSKEYMNTLKIYRLRQIGAIPLTFDTKILLASSIKALDAILRESKGGEYYTIDNFEFLDTFEFFGYECEDRNYEPEIVINHYNTLRGYI